ncbi:MAG: sugar ABC transporter permease [Anaerolineae bacterium]|nr:sugar ABC transporter permease [Anaerolineae bacterium]MCA9888090.1 sugar ABC transporter permease [Anaerolineae bacterium]MCB9461119.1 sugar ABC transporter permease [Anaerolineaceae bacterium]
MENVASKGRVAQEQRGLSRKQRNLLWGLLFTSPAIIGFFLWQFGPIMAAIGISLTEWKIVGTPEWIGLANYQKIFTTDPLFLKSVSVTLIYTALSVPASIAFAFFLAVLLDQKVRLLPVFRTIFYLPSIVPFIASSYLWLWLFNPDFGALNAIIRPLGLPESKWIFASDSVLPSLALMSLWGVGGTMLIFLAGLQGVPKQLYEAVEVDGGNVWHKMRHVTIPIMTPVIFFNFVLTTINTLQTFTQPFVMTQGGPNNASLFYVLYLYRKAFRQSDMGYASALSIILLLIIGVLTYIIFRTSSLWVFYEGERD